MQIIIVALIAAKLSVFSVSRLPNLDNFHEAIFFPLSKQLPAISITKAFFTLALSFRTLVFIMANARAFAAALVLLDPIFISVTLTLVAFAALTPRPPIV